MSTDNFSYVIDGDYLLRKVAWDSYVSYGDAYKAHVNFINTYFKNKAIIFFENHCHPTTDPATADIFRKMLLPKSNSIQFNENTKLIHTKDKLLSNYNNKILFIAQLVSVLERENIQVRQVKSSLFEVSIVKTLLNIPRLEKSACLISKTVDLPILLLHYVDVNDCNNIYFLKPSVKNSKKLCLSIEKIVHGYLSNAAVKELLLPIYAFIGSRLTSSIAHHSKSTVMNRIISEIKQNKGHLMYFTIADAYSVDIINAGRALFRRIYSIKDDFTLSISRYAVFTKAISK